MPANYKVLLAEDDSFLSSLLKNRLKKEGLEVRTAQDGEAVIKELNASVPDVLLLDLILPKKSGFELLQEIRQEPRFENIPIIIISNLGQPEDINKGMKFGIVDYFIKAKMSIDDLVGKVKKYLETNVKKKDPAPSAALTTSPPQKPA